MLWLQRRVGMTEHRRVDGGLVASHTPPAPPNPNPFLRCEMLHMDHSAFFPPPPPRRIIDGAPRGDPNGVVQATNTYVRTVSAHTLLLLSRRLLLSHPPPPRVLFSMCAQAAKEAMNKNAEQTDVDPGYQAMEAVSHSVSSSGHFGVGGCLVGAG